jgi:soluble lytic murein transglycosylase-like protein
MRNNLRQIHPHARLWIATAIILGLILVLKTPAKFIAPPYGKVVAYYQNDYQRYAVDKLVERNNLEQYPCLYEMWMRESNWSPKSLNKQSKALGIAQLKPSTWVNIKTQPTYDGYKQVEAGLKYIDRHYGKNNICKAYAHHLALGWY